MSAPDWTRNPYAEDTERREIWEILVRRDTEAFIEADFGRCEADFDEGFWAMDAQHSSDPDRWRLAFPRLSEYRAVWLEQAAAFAQVELVNTDKRELIFRASRLDPIDIADQRAVAHKKFSGTAPKRGGGSIVLDWQSLYFLRKVDGRWKVTGFLGYLPKRT